VRCPDPGISPDEALLRDTRRRVCLTSAASGRCADEDRGSQGLPGVDAAVVQVDRTDDGTAQAARVLAIVNCSLRVAAGVVSVGFSAVKR
jgi:hypothetical protein